MSADARDRIQREYDELQPAGLVLGHVVLVAKVGVGQAHRGRVTALDSDVTIRLDRVKWSDAFRAGDRVRALHTGRHAVEAMVVEAGHGKLRLRLVHSGEER